MVRDDPDARPHRRSLRRSPVWRHSPYMDFHAHSLSLSCRPRAPSARNPKVDPGWEFLGTPTPEGRY